MTFNHNTFATQLDNTSGVTVGKDSSGNYEWDNMGWDNDLCTYLNYTKGDYGYRTWYQETSEFASNIGMVVSCKLDFKRTTGDDHIILMVGFNNASGTPQIVYAQASVQFNGDDDDNIVSDKILASSAGSAANDIATGLYNSLHDQISTIDFGNIDDSTEGRNELPEIAKINVLAMANSIG